MNMFGCVECCSCLLLDPIHVQEQILFCLSWISLLLVQVVYFYIRSMLGCQSLQFLSLLCFLYFSFWVRVQLLAYNNRLLSLPINSFKELCDYGTRIQDAINTRQLDLNKAKHQAKKVFNEGETGGALNNVNVILARLQKRVFDDLQMPLSEVLAILIERGGGGGAPQAT